MGLLGALIVDLKRWGFAKLVKQSGRGPDRTVYAPLRWSPRPLSCHCNFFYKMNSIALANPHPLCLGTSSNRRCGGAGWSGAKPAQVNRADPTSDPDQPALTFSNSFCLRPRFARYLTSSNCSIKCFSRGLRP